MADNDMENNFQRLLSRLKSPTEAESPVSASDVVAGFQNGRPASTVSNTVHQESPAPSSNPQDYLLKLLQSQTVASPSSSNMMSATATPPPVQATNGTPTVSKPSPFTYSNPFDQLTKPQPAQSPNPLSSRSTPRVDSLPLRTASTTAAVVSESKTSDDSPESLSISHQDPPVKTISEAPIEVSEQVDKPEEDAEDFAKYNLDKTKENQHNASDSQIVTHQETKQIVTQDESDESESAASGPTDWQADNTDIQPFVYSLPMKPFASLAVISQKEAALPLPAADTVLFIVRSKKEFDQLDRNLVACTPEHIVYALKEKGIRVVDAQTGRFEDMFNDKNGDHVYSVLTSIISSSDPPSRDFELAIATGAKGGLFWSKLESLGQRTPQRSFNFAPHVAEQDAAGPSSGLLKTRVKASNRHPQFFAYGRGKHIHFVWPSQASSQKFTDPSTGICDSERYLASTNVRIAAGKAAKDFAFSVDDTVIASLDKAGKLKFWDIQVVTSFDGVHNDPVDHLIDTPLMIFNTTQPGEKSWPTSVMFVDKEKTMTKGYACRYMIIGMKQNHVIQIWDLALGKPVQEITFPHGDESDPLLSLSYCPRSATLAVGHPIRNTIFLLHVSYPPYKYHPFSQAKFLSLLADKEKRVIPPPASTTIVDHIQEYSLSGIGDIGELRSFDLMVGEPDEAADTPGYMCTLICMHSKGIFQYALTKPNLGLGEDGNSHRAVDAVKSSIIEIKDIVQPLQDDNISTTASKSTTETPLTSEKDKKKKKKAESSVVPSETPLKIASPANNIQAVPPNVPTDASQETEWREMVSEVVKAELATLQKSLDKTRHDDHLFFTGNQTEILKLVEQSLQSNLVTWRSSLENAVDRSVRAHLKDFSRGTGYDVEELLERLPNKIQSNLAPSLQAFSSQSAALTAKEVESRYQNLLARHETKQQQQNQLIARLNNQIETMSAKYEAKMQQDAQSIDQLSAQINTLTAAVTALAKLQGDLQNDIVSRLNTQVALPPPVQAPIRFSDPLFKDMQDLINQDRFDDALVMWLRSPNQAGAFDEVFVKYTSDFPKYIQNTNHLIVLSIVAAATISLETSIAARLEWVERALEKIELNDGDIKAHLPKIMDLLIGRLQQLYEASKPSDANNPIMIKVHKIGHRATELKRAVMAEYAH